MGASAAWRLCDCGGGGGRKLLAWNRNVVEGSSSQCR